LHIFDCPTWIYIKRESQNKISLDLLEISKSLNFSPLKNLNKEKMDPLDSLLKAFRLYSDEAISGRAKRAFSYLGNHNTRC
jgi:hypothetical protein